MAGISVHVLQQLISKHITSIEQRFDAEKKQTCHCANSHSIPPFVVLCFIVGIVVHFSAPVEAARAVFRQSCVIGVLNRFVEHVFPERREI